LDAENEKIFRESQKVWTAVEELRVNESVNVEAELEKVKQGCSMYYVQSTDDDLQITNKKDREDPEKKPTLSPVHHLSIFMLFLRAAAIFILLAVPSFFLFRYLQQPSMKELAATTSRVESLLPDGSKVTLNTGAVIRYPETFKGKKRAVSLEGEAYFDVTHNAAKPFIISTDGIRIEVKGTSFYINTRSMSGDFELVLTTGQVELYFENQEGGARILNPGEKAIIHNNEIIINPNHDANYMAWKTHRIAFSNDPLNSVAATLSKVYQADVRLTNPVLALCRLTATFDNQSLESVLNVLKATLDVDIRNSGSIVEISGKGCR